MRHTGSKAVIATFEHYNDRVKKLLSQHIPFSSVARFSDGTLRSVLLESIGEGNIVRIEYLSNTEKSFTQDMTFDLIAGKNILGICRVL